MCNAAFVNGQLKYGCGRTMIGGTHAGNVQHGVGVERRGRMGVGVTVSMGVGVTVSAWEWVSL